VVAIEDCCVRKLKHREEDSIKELNFNHLALYLSSEVIRTGLINLYDCWS
jgi:hypothetical protein